MYIVSTLLPPMQWKNIAVKNCHCCWDTEAILWKKCFVPVTRAELFLWKNFHHQYRDLGRKVRDFGNRGSPRASHFKKLIFFFPKKRAAMRDLRNRASSVDRANMKRPLLRTPVGFIAQVLVEHRTGIRGGHGFESRWSWSPDFFFPGFFFPIA